MPHLADRFTVIAPDLAGHGESAKPRGDYSLGAHASGLRDLLLTLGHERATFVGHSLGGGIVMQFSYQFPERCERLVLVDSGGLGRDVNWLLRAATLPGSELVLPFLAATRLLDAGARAGGLLSRLGLGLGTDLEEIARGHSTLSDSAARAAFVHRFARSSSRRPAGRRLEPALSGRTFPVPTDLGRARLDHPRLPWIRDPRPDGKQSLEVFPRSGHFPQLDEPERFLDVLVEFIDSTQPAARERTV